MSDVRSRNTRTFSLGGRSPAAGALAGRVRSDIIRLWLGCVLLVPALSLFGCATPVGVSRVGLENAYREINATAITGMTLSPETRIVLRRFDLEKLFESDPAATIALLHEQAVRDPRRDVRLALAELSFLYGKQLDLPVPVEKRSLPMTIDERPTGASEYYLMSAIYAYDYLLGTTGAAPTNSYDRQFQAAADLYNLALGKGLATGKDGRLEFRNGVRELPVGRIAISVKPEGLQWPLEDYEIFLPADEYSVHGFSVRNRTPGLGLPLIARRKKTPEYPMGPVMPVTAFLRVTGAVSDLGGDAARASLEFYSAYDERDLVVNGRKVPMETDLTAPMAYRLNEPDIWNQLGVRRFLSGKDKPTLFMMQPSRPGRIPVVFIHGTASSPLWWGEMWNTLNSDPVLRQRYQFWFFMYNSSIPMAVSAAALRETLSATVAKLDPQGKDPALHEMVLVGHSQGGLLTKLSVVKTGDALWRSISDVSVDKMKAKPAIKKKIRDYFFIEPLPFVTRVVYISTPHRGSFRTTPVVQWLIRWLVSLPGDLLTTNPMNYLNPEQLKLPPELRGRSITSVDSMSAKNPVIRALGELPVAPGVKAHSIIAVEGEGDPTKGNDGVVEYSSAHQEGVESEFIVRSSHSSQGNPLTIEEVRRILLVHLAAISPPPRTQEGREVPGP